MRLYIVVIWYKRIERTAARYLANKEILTNEPKRKPGRPRKSEIIPTFLQINPQHILPTNIVPTIIVPTTILPPNILYLKIN